MTLNPPLRRLVLCIHIATSVGLIGAVASFLALSLAGLLSDNEVTVRAVYIAMDQIAWLIILPLAITALLVGIVQSLGTPWGLIRHYWVIAKLLLTILIVGVLLLQMGAISSVADGAVANLVGLSDDQRARVSLTFHAGAGLLVLFLPVWLSVYKPRGTTRFA